MTKHESEVIILDDFYSKKFGTSRKIFIYLPPGYKEGQEKYYPVLYMHAGQRIFDPINNKYGSWYVHHAANRLIAEGMMQEIIIIGIAHKWAEGKNEFYHFISPDQGIRCSGLTYEEFIIDELKPYIDENFRTLTGPEDTGLIGSSAAALATYHIGMRRPDIFGKIGVMSPYIVKVNDDHSEYKLYATFQEKKALSKIWFDIGGAEGMFLVRHVRELVDDLLAKGYRYGEELLFYHDPEAAHFEEDWSRRIHLPLLYFYGQIGEPTVIELGGRDRVGLRGMQVKLEPKVTYATGFSHIELNADYRVANPNILEINADGTIIPKAIGTTMVTCQFGGLQASKEITVQDYLSPYVEISVTVDVPADSPEIKHLYMGAGMVLDPTGPNRFGGHLKLPRDLACHFKFTRGFRLFELDREGNEIENRKFRASEDQELHYTVENWASLETEKKG